MLAVRRLFRVVPAVLLLTSPTPGSAQPASRPEPDATLTRAKVPAKDVQESVVRIARLGRYAISVQSRQGSALQLVDRMAGPGEVAGVAGEKDGRLDVFLDRGEYLVKILSHEKGTGEASLEVKRFTERNEKPSLLVELKPVEDTLSDFEQRSYWLDIQERRTVILEAAGRNLTDLRLWKDGNWLVDAAPRQEVVQPRVGKPLAICRLATVVEPGLYLLTAYGSRGQPWAEDASEHPFDLRWGIPTVGEAGRRRHVVSAMGVDRFVVPGSATYYRLELPEAKPATLRVSDFNPEKPLEEVGRSAAVSKNSLPPAGDGGASPMANSASDVQIVVDAANQRNVYMTTPAYGARILEGVTSAVSRDEAGFWVELRIEKRALDPDLPGSGGGFGLDFNFRDNDGGNDPRRTTVYTWSDGEESGPFPSKIPGHWGRARLLP